MQIWAEKRNKRNEQFPKIKAFQQLHPVEVLTTSSQAI